jgi:signal transduction histidine kinase
MGGTPAERDLVRQLLEPEGHDVVEAPAGPEGVDLARRIHPELILLDLMSLPADYETATRLRSFPETQHVPLVTMGPAEDREQALSLGCDGYIATPLKAQRFLREVQAFLRGKRQRVRSTVQRHHLEAYSKRLVEKLEAKVGELTRTNERLRQIDGLKNQVLENVSHELATPLTPLIGYLDLLESGRLGPVAPRQRRALTSIAHGIRRLGRTVDSLLDLASLQDAESAAPSFEGLDPSVVAEEALEALRGKARTRKVALDLRCPAPATVRADRGRLRQALIHLLDNAITYSPRGGHVLLEVVSSNGKTRFSVYDQGEVIPAELEGQVFDLFSPPGRRSSAGASGPTLGVAVARRIAEAHAGSASVESPPRNQPDTLHPYPGARFSIELPAS